MTTRRPSTSCTATATFEPPATHAAAGPPRRTTAVRRVRRVRRDHPDRRRSQKPDRRVGNLRDAADDVNAADPDPDDRYDDRYGRSSRAPPDPLIRRREHRRERARVRRKLRFRRLVDVGVQGGSARGSRASHAPGAISRARITGRRTRQSRVARRSRTASSFGAFGSFLETSSGKEPSRSPSSAADGSGKSGESSGKLGALASVAARLPVRDSHDFDELVRDLERM